MTTRHRRRKRLPVIAVLALATTMGAAACAPSDDASKPEAAVTTTASPQQVESLRAQLRALPGVTDADVKFVPAPKFASAAWDATITADGLDQAALVDLVDKAYRVVWNDPNLPFADLAFSVENGQGATAGFRALGFVAPPTWTDMLDRYGPRPSNGTK